MPFARKGKPLAPPPPGTSDFWVTVHVKFPVPIPDETDPGGTPTQGYYQNLGVRSSSERFQELVSASIAGGRIDWDDTRWDVVNPAELDRTIRKRIEPVESEGVWYRSGRILYADPDLEPPPS